MKGLHRAGIGRFIGVSLTLLALCVSETGFAQAHHEPPLEQDTIFTEHIPGAERLEGQLLAPCCWDASRQTLDIHGSPIAIQLRREIRTRLKAGEDAEAIKADLVSRYSQKILAVPPGNPLKELGVMLSLIFGLAAVGVGAIVLKWKKRGTAARAARTPKGSARQGHDAEGRDEWDEKLDAELDRVDS